MTPSCLTLVHRVAYCKIQVFFFLHLTSFGLKCSDQSINSYFYLFFLQVNINFGTRLDDLIVENGQVLGIEVSNARQEAGPDNQKLFYDAVVLAVGHSARDVYQMLLQHDVDLIPKDFAVSCDFIKLIQ